MNIIKITEHIIITLTIICSLQSCSATSSVVQPLPADNHVSQEVSNTYNEVPSIETDLLKEYDANYIFEDYYINGLYWLIFYDKIVIVEDLGGLMNTLEFFGKDIVEISTYYDTDFSQTTVTPVHGESFSIALQRDEAELLMTLFDTFHFAAKR